MDRLNVVTVRTPRLVFEMTWEQREAIVRLLAEVAEAHAIVDSFRAVGATRPVELTGDQVDLLRAHFARFTPDDLPDVLYVRDALDAA
jgi:hypothetical protein